MNTGHTFFGRRVIYTEVYDITRDNIASVLNSALQTHYKNKREIKYLYEYFRGKQPILDRQKNIRPEINNKIVENRANEIVSFKTGYLIGEPVMYVSRNDEGNQNIEGINKLNEYMYSENKRTKDRELAEWFHICGTAYRMTLPNKGITLEDDPPFRIYNCDPRNSFIVYYSGLGHEARLSRTYSRNEKGDIVYSCYTDSRLFTIINGQVVKEEPHTLGMIPMVEYPANPSRLGAFEIVLPLLDAINETESDRLDGIDQFIQALMIFKGVDITSDEFGELREQGALKVPPDGDVTILTQELDQTQTQTYVDSMYDSVLTICGMPNRNGGSSTSDTGAATIMRDGWYAAEARAKDTEAMFEAAERESLKLVIRITNSMRKVNLKLSDIGIRFTRRNYENIQEKAQVLTMMLASDKIAPKLAFESCGMFIDPEVAYITSERYAKEQEEAALADMENDIEQTASLQKNVINTGGSSELAQAV